MLSSRRSDGGGGQFTDIVPDSVSFQQDCQEQIDVHRPQRHAAASVAELGHS